MDYQHQEFALRQMPEQSGLLICRALVKLNHEKPACPRVVESLVAELAALCPSLLRRHRRRNDELHPAQKPETLPLLKRPGAEVRLGLADTNERVGGEQGCNELLGVPLLLGQANWRLCAQLIES